ncbi:SH3 domain-containing protein [Butyrivibrio sp. YAB3001]|uniref:SH3 domain-containing protein n=1 Tax=Butyrivibrio sp. YAB3001 TaxID=1520812 RepID=UPI0008F64AF8|nr:SH3 domain-containing protein [Butyrivibrio sp. YAB3001]SFC10909.1 SH3 domain-containing protein [Butyrivibrio sp. YAB3001]
MLKRNYKLIVLGAGIVLALSIHVPVYAQQAADQTVSAQTQQNTEQGQQSPENQQKTAQQQDQQQAQASQQQNQTNQNQQPEQQTQQTQQQNQSQQQSQQNVSSSQEQGTQESVKQEEAQPQQQQKQNTNKTQQTKSSKTKQAESTDAKQKATENQDEADQEGQEENTDEINEPQTEEAAFILTFNKNANIRSEASTSSNKLVVIPYGIKISSPSKVNSGEGVWYKVTYGGLTGYVREDMVSAEKVENAEKGKETEKTLAESESNEGDEATQVKTETVLGVSNDQSGNQKNSTTGGGNAASDDLLQEIEGSEAVSEGGETKIAELQTEDAVISQTHRIDLITVLFIFLSGLSFVLAFLTYLRLMVEYKKSRAYVLKRIMKDEHHIKTQ